MPPADCSVVTTRPLCISRRIRRRHWKSYLACCLPSIRSREVQNAELKSLASPGEYFQGDFDKYDLETRIKATRGMIVDFALLSGAWIQGGPDAIVCTVRCDSYHALLK